LRRKKKKKKNRRESASALFVVVCRQSMMEDALDLDGKISLSQLNFPSHSLQRHHHSIQMRNASQSGPSRSRKIAQEEEIDANKLFFCLPRRHRCHSLRQHRPLLHLLRRQTRHERKHTPPGRAASAREHPGQPCTWRPRRLAARRRRRARPIEPAPRPGPPRRERWPPRSAGWPRPRREASGRTPSA
jgi:hypothetical protein